MWLKIPLTNLKNRLGVSPQTECCVSPEDFLHEMVGRGLPAAAQLMTAMSLCSTFTSLGSSSHLGGTEIGRVNIRGQSVHPVHHSVRW